MENFNISINNTLKLKLMNDNLLLIILQFLDISAKMTYLNLNQKFRNLIKNDLFLQIYFKLTAKKFYQPFNSKIHCYEINSFLHKKTSKQNLDKNQEIMIISSYLNFLYKHHKTLKVQFEDNITKNSHLILLKFLLTSSYCKIEKIIMKFPSGTVRQSNLPDLDIVIDSIKLNFSLHSIEIKNFPIKEINFSKSIWSLIALKPLIKKLLISDYLIEGEKHMKEIFDNLSMNTNLVDITFENFVINGDYKGIIDFIRSKNNFKSIYFGFKMVNYEKEILKAFGNHKHLESLNISGYKDIEGLTFLCESNLKLKKLIFHGGDLENKLVYVSNIIKSLSTIKYLDISHTSYNSHFTVLFSAMNTNLNSLETLILHNCRINYDYLTKILKALQCNKFLKFFDLSSNPLNLSEEKDEVLNYHSILKEFLYYNKIILEINLKDCHLESSIVEYAYNKLFKRKILEKF